MVVLLKIEVGWKAKWGSWFDKIVFKNGTVVIFFHSIFDENQVSNTYRRKTTPDHHISAAMFHSFFNAIGMTSLIFLSLNFAMAIWSEDVEFRLVWPNYFITVEHSPRWVSVPEILLSCDVFCAQCWFECGWASFVIITMQNSTKFPQKFWHLMINSILWLLVSARKMIIANILENSSFLTRIQNAGTNCSWKSMKWTSCVKLLNDTAYWTSF